jgi:hypothetical protein
VVNTEMTNRLEQTIVPHDGTIPVTRVSVQSGAQMTQVLEGVGALVVVPLSLENAGQTAQHITSPSPAHATLMLASAIALVRQQYGEVAVHAALDVSRTITFEPNGG